MPADSRLAYRISNQMALINSTVLEACIMLIIAE